MVENETVASFLLEEERDDGIVYLDNAGQARLSSKVQKAGLEAVIGGGAPRHADDDQRLVRRLFSKIIDAHERCIALHPSTAFAITLAAENIYAQLCIDDDSSNKKCEILVLQDQMCSAVYPWQNICEKSGGKLKLLIVPHPNSNTSTSKGWTELVVERLEAGTVVAACLPPLHWSDGALLDLPRISRVCQENDVKLIVDSTQATGICENSVKEIQPALMACSSHKWLRGPSGVSLVYIAPELHSLWKPLDQHGRGRDFGSSGSDMGRNGYPERFFPDARKFDSGGKPNPILLPMLRASLEEVVQLDVKKAQERLQTLMTPLLDWARSHKYELPVPAVGPQYAYHLIGIRPKHLTPQQMCEIVTALQQEEGIYMAVRCGAFRISPYVDNKKEDIERLIAALEKHCVS